MLPVPPSEKVNTEVYPKFKPINIVSPPGTPEEECGDLAALVGHKEGGTFDGGPMLITFWKPSEEEIEALKEGAVIELVFFDAGMPMTAMNVEYL